MSIPHEAEQLIFETFEKSKKPLTISEISISSGFPKNFVDKFLQDLFHRGLVAYSRGIEPSIKKKVAYYAPHYNLDWFEDKKLFKIHFFKKIALVRDGKIITREVNY